MSLHPSMPLNPASLKTIPVSFATVSIGKPTDPLPDKLSALASAGFTGIELGFPDLLSFASSHHGHEVGPKDFDELVSAAKEVKKLCDEKSLKIMLLQPFSNFEGWEEGSEEKKDAWERAEGWIRILEATDCETLQVGSSDTPSTKIGTSRSRFVNDLQALADLLAKHNKRLAYENWCWSTHAPDWADVWDICRLVDRPNFGLCLDTFQTAGGEWADPSTETGLLKGKTKEECDAGLKGSLEKLAKTIPAEKIYLLQISDAYKLDKPIKSEDEDGMRPRGQWSHDYRPVLFQGGYLPVVDVARAVLKTGFRSWFSYEVFDSGKDGKGKEYKLEDFAKEAFACQEKLLAECAKE